VKNVFSCFINTNCKALGHVTAQAIGPVVIEVLPADPQAWPRDQ
jgi:hypothetical protein